LALEINSKFVRKISHTSFWDQYYADPFFYFFVILGAARFVLSRPKEGFIIREFCKALIRIIKNKQKILSTKILAIVNQASYKIDPSSGTQDDKKQNKKSGSL
jgi:hypothetical protein